uniref:Cryptide Pep-19 n=1 Tax=Tityus obscurus TaxID=1221240 RepID=CRY19_TITOB
LFGAFALV